MGKQNIGYLLPSEPSTEDFGCCLVFYPDKDEYRRALFGSLDYLGTWVAWEKESGHGGIIASALWKAANELTRECCNMGFCDQLLTKLDRIIALLALMRIDGGDTITYNDNRIVTTTIVPGVGDAPTTWGETAVSDWDEWLEYVCGSAQAWVDDLIDTAEQMALLKTALGFTIEFLSHFFSRLVYRLPQPIIPMNYPFLAFVFDLLDEVIDDVSFSTVAANFETYRNSMVCAILQDGDLGAALEAAVDDSVLWNAFYRWIDVDSVKATIYEGSPDGENFLDPVASTTCNCDFAVPAGYEIVPAALNACISGSPFCNGVSVADNVITLTAYNQTAGFRVSLDAEMSVVGCIVIGDVSPVKTWIAADGSCSGKSAQVGNAPWNPSGYTFGFINTGIRDDFLDYISNFPGAQVNPGGACSAVDDFQFKNNAGGEVSGTWECYHIVAV